MEITSFILGVCAAIVLLMVVGTFVNYMSVKSLKEQVDDINQMMIDIERDIYNNVDDLNKELHNEVDEVYKTIDSRFDKFENRINQNK